MATSMLHARIDSGLSFSFNLKTIVVFCLCSKDNVNSNNQYN
ncbi:hypothetical protein HanXRQr2_Chr06g0276941 [Helianthus annuus]|uniref:Uncharacterized protein n=1 Tax=Helianthus annuus TaxID=4232 RepID=A0A9K3IVM5_HELAN|nr:hypothetical protein HanXRQr2_Chr06g0276941 [Helianthus annuus]KAJ0916952.1 hypothetical protein HanPSC8_Chr06g0267751 [Helianthus annuus]